jgi:hypothetical protein
MAPFAPVLRAEWARSVDEQLDAAAEARLSELDRVRDATARRLAELRVERERAMPEGADKFGPDPIVEWTPQRKIALFAGLFRGREDVFPLRWEKPAKGKSGWALRCANEWKPGVCGKPRVKCGACPNQAFLAPLESELLAHLGGRHAMGVYPLLADDRCWLLAIDLDGDSWRDDIAALRETCREFDVVPAVERSRSGEGADVWFFFAAPVEAALARRFGMLLLTDAMTRTATLGMSSYDRLFPSQDTLPKGGFGNLIALPLARAARERGNTLFLDECLEPFEDQWSYLASLPRIALARLQDVVADCSRDGRVLGVPEDPADDAPWRPLSRSQAGSPQPSCPTR